MHQLKGTGIALVTPFNEDFSIDFDSLEKLIEHAIGGGINYLVLLGTTGESAVLSKDEKKEVVDFCKKINNGRLPLVQGLGGNNTLALVEELRISNFEGIDAILSVSPYYNKPTQEGIYLHYKMLSEASPLPLIVYNVPGRTASNISAETTLRLGNDFENIVAVKEASADLTQIEKIINDKPDDFLVLSGDDGLTSTIIERGGDGVIAVVGQSHPGTFSNMVNAGLNREFEKAKLLHEKLNPIYDPLYADGNPAGIKAVLNIMGICKNVLRPPLVSTTQQTFDKLQSFIVDEHQ
jgi:4-hydroxy-tetrahydrodipicolinate synthase